tara:strand:- start:932 stop:2443 length:1512 start_codon:yes stop_codon:yes gene_type:complete
MIQDLKPLMGKLSVFAKERMGFSHPPRLFLKNDTGNSKLALGRTAHYDPQEKSITLFIHSRHPKDILRSLAHELVHHTQNLRGDLTPEKMSNMGKNYAQDNEHMRNMEKEAYLVGNMCFRDFEDGLDEEDKRLYKLAESKHLKENKRMANKLTKEVLQKTIRRILIQEQTAGQRVPAKQPSAPAPKVAAPKAAKVAKKPKAEHGAVRSSSRNRAVQRLAARNEAHRKKFWGGVNLFDVQQALFAAGFYAGTPQGRQFGGNPTSANPEAIEKIVDGDFGPSTLGAIRNFQAHQKFLKNQRKGELDANGFSALTMFVLDSGINPDDTGAKDQRLKEGDPLADAVVADFENKAPQEARKPEDDEKVRATDPGMTDMAGDVTFVPKEKAGTEKKENLEEKKKCCPKGTPGCPGPGKRGGPHKGLFESEELEEKKGKKKPGLKNPKKADLNKDGKLSSYEKKRGKAIEKSMASESKVQTPEQENTLYEQRFTPKNNRLFEKLLKEWTK